MFFKIFQTLFKFWRISNLTIFSKKNQTNFFRMRKFLKPYFKSPFEKMLEI